VGADIGSCFCYSLSKKAQAARQGYSITYVYFAGQQKVKAIFFFAKTNDQPVIFIAAAFYFGLIFSCSRPICKIKI